MLKQKPPNNEMNSPRFAMEMANATIFECVKFRKRKKNKIKSTERKSDQTKTHM